MILNALNRVAFYLFFIGLCSCASPGSSQEEQAFEPVVELPPMLASFRFDQRQFQFSRLRYEAVGASKRTIWATDYPDADRNFSRHMELFERLEVDLDGAVVRPTELLEQSFLYLCEPGSMSLSDADATALREHLLGGGFLMVDDFWGDKEWEHTIAEFKRVFPDLAPEALPLSHDVFHCVFDLKQKPQVFSVRSVLVERPETLAAMARRDPVEYYGIFDKEGRMLVILCRNTDLADGWERSDADERYREEYSRALAYPMGINIAFFSLTQ